MVTYPDANGDLVTVTAPTRVDLRDRMDHFQDVRQPTAAGDHRAVNAEIATLAEIITHDAMIADMADRVIHSSDGYIVNIRENARAVPCAR